MRRRLFQSAVPYFLSAVQKILSAGLFFLSQRQGFPMRRPLSQGQHLMFCTGHNALRKQAAESRPSLAVCKYSERRAPGQEKACFLLGMAEPHPIFVKQIRRKASAGTRESLLSSRLERSAPAFGFPRSPKNRSGKAEEKIFFLQKQKIAIFVLQNTLPLVSKIKTPHKISPDKRHNE